MEDAAKGRGYPSNLKYCQVKIWEEGEVNQAGCEKQETDEERLGAGGGGGGA